MTTPEQIDSPTPIRHLSDTRCYAADCDGIAELGEAYCWQHIGADDWVERLRRSEPVIVEAIPGPLLPGMRVRITAGRFEGMSGRLTGLGPEWAGVDLGVPIDGDSGLVSVPVSAVREVEP